MKKIIDLLFVMLATTSCASHRQTNRVIVTGTLYEASVNKESSDSLLFDFALNKALINNELFIYNY